MTTSGRPPESKQAAGAQPPRRRAAMTRFALEAGAGAVLVVAAAAILFGGAGDWAALLLFVTAALALAVCGRRQATALRRVERLQRPRRWPCRRIARRLNDDLLLALADAIDLRQPRRQVVRRRGALCGADGAGDGAAAGRVELLPRRAGARHRQADRAGDAPLQAERADRRRNAAWQDHAAAGADLLGGTTPCRR